MAQRGIETEVSFEDLDLNDLDIVLAEETAAEIEARSGDVEIAQDASEDLDGVIADLKIEEVKAEAYAAAEKDAEETGVLPTPAAVSETAAPAKAIKAKTPKAPAAPRASRSLNDLPDAAFILVKDDSRDGAMVKAETLGLIPNAKKIREKAENLLMALHDGKLPSAYLIHVWKMLAAKGSFTPAETVAMLSERGYKIGTARAQAQQVVQLLPALKLTVIDGKKQARNPASRLADKLDAVIAAGTGTAS